MPKVQVNPQPPKKKAEQELQQAEEKLEPVAIDFDALDASKRPIKYPQIEVCGIPIPVESMKVTVDMVKDWMGWETESEYAARMVVEYPETRPEQHTFDPEKMFTVKDMEKNLCTAWYNLDNRPLDMKSVMKIAQDILNRCWAGPTTFPGETVNGETMVIGRTGANISLQHRGIALIFAAQMWQQQNPHWCHFWAEEPFLETLWVTGVSENQRVTTTVDQSRSRTSSDSIYTSQVFRHHPDGSSMTRKERGIHSKILENAESLLWKRTNVKEINRWEEIPSASARRQFTDRHPRLVDAVKFIYSLSGPGAQHARVFNKLKLNDGDCAAMLYLMGASSTDEEKYKEMDAPGEKILVSIKERGLIAGRKAVNFDMWGTAEEFWRLFSIAGEGLNTKFFEVRNAIMGLTDPNDPSNKARLSDKMAVLSKAWAIFKDGKLPDASDLELHFTTDGEGRRHLDGEDYAYFGGIDTADPKEKDTAPPQTLADDIASVAKGRAEKAEQHRRMVEESERRQQPEEASRVQPTFDTDGKPPIPKLLKTPLLKATKPMSQKEINAAQTAQAAKHDAEDAAAKSKLKPVDQGKLRKGTRS